MSLSLLYIEQEQTTLQRFVQFHEANPEVYRKLESLAQGMWDAGRRRVGMKMLFEILRWQHYLRTVDTSSEFKLNNNFTALYSRLLVARHPEWEGLFEMRHLKDDEMGAAFAAWMNKASAGAWDGDMNEHCPTCHEKSFKIEDRGGDACCCFEDARNGYEGPMG